MTIIQSIILGIIQGIGEFLPISSSAHLIIIPYLFNFDLSLTESEKLAFDVALHFGTLMSVTVIFFKDWLNMAKGVLNKLFKKEDSFDNRLFWYLVIATIPGALIGVLFEEVIENVVRNNKLIIALSLAIMGVLIYLGDKYASKKYKKPTELEKISLKQALLVGVSQAFAVIPGFSRSGTTILAGRLLGLSKEAIAKFTFLLSTPIIFGAFIMNVGDLMFTKEVIVGIVTSFIVGILSIKFLLNYIKKHDFSIFAFYRVIIALLVLIKLIF